MTETWALMPFKRLCDAKRRLAPALDSATRKALASAMANDVLSALTASSAVARVLVVTNEPEAGNLFPDRGLEIFYSARTEGLNRELEHAARFAGSRGARGVLVVHADLPYLTPNAIDRLAEKSPQRELRVVPCKDGVGTNALLAPVPGTFRFGFGRDSLERHRDLASRNHLDFRLVRDEGLETDIDSPADLDRMRNEGFSLSPPGRYTQAVLQRLEPARPGTPC